MMEMYNRSDLEESQMNNLSFEVNLFLPYFRDSNME